MAHPIQLVVKLDKRNDSGGKTCRIDTSQGLQGVLHQVASRFDLDIQRLSHIIYGRHNNPIATSAIETADVLRDFDIVLADVKEVASMLSQTARPSFNKQHGQSSKKESESNSSYDTNKTNLS